MTQKSDREKLIEREVNKTLGSLDGWGDIEPGPHFYARLQQRLANSEETSEPRLARLLLGYRVAPSLLALFLILNVMTAWMVLGSRKEALEEYRQAGIAAVAEEFSITEISLLSGSGFE